MKKSKQVRFLTPEKIDHNLKYGRAVKALRDKRKRSIGKNPCGKK